MKNKQLKVKLLRQNEQIATIAKDAIVLNFEQLNNANGGKGGACPLLVSCGVYGLHNCTIKLWP